MPGIRMKTEVKADNDKNALGRDLRADEDIQNVDQSIADQMVRDGLADYLDAQGNVSLDNDATRKANAEAQRLRDQQVGAGATTRPQTANAQRPAARDQTVAGAASPRGGESQVTEAPSPKSSKAPVPEKPQSR